MGAMTKGELLSRIHRMERLVEQLPEDAEILEVNINWIGTDMIQSCGTGDSSVEALARTLGREVTRRDLPRRRHRRISLQVGGVTVMELREKGDRR